MKEFEDMTAQEKQDLLEQIKNLPDEPEDPVDLFTQSFKELSGLWNESLKEFDKINSDYKLLSKTKT